MRRRIRRSSLVALIIFLVLLIAGAVLLRWQNAWVAEHLAGIITRNLLSERGYALQLEGFDGNLGGELDLEGVRVRYRGERREPFDLFEARNVHVSFDPFSILRGDFRSTELELEGTVLRAFGIESEGWAYPGFDPEPGRRSSVEVDLESVRISELLLLRETEAGVDSLRVAMADFSLFRNSGGSSLDLKRFSAEQSGSPALDLRGRFFLSGRGDLTLAGVQLQLPRTRMALRGFVELNRGPALKLSVDASPVRLGEIAALLRADLDDDSELFGSVRVEGTTDSLGLAGRLSGRLFSYELEEMEFAGSYTPGVLSFDRLAGMLNHSSVEGHGRFELPLGGTELGIRAESRLDSFDLATFLGGGLVTDLSGLAGIRVDGDRQSFHLDLGPGSVDAYSFQQATGDLELQADTLVLRGIRFWDEGLDAGLAGRIHPEAGRIDVSGEGLSRSSAWARRFSGDPCLEGDLDFHTRFQGKLDGPRFELEGTMREVNYFGAALERGQLTLSSDSLVALPLSIHIEGEDFDRFGLSFDRLYLDASLFGEELQLRHASLDADRAQLLLAGTIDLGRAPPGALFERLWLRWLGEDWLNDRPLALDLGDSLRLGPAEWYSGRGHLRVDWGQDESAGDRFTIEDLDLGQLAPWIPANLEASGSLSGELRRLPAGGFGMNAHLGAIQLGGLPAGELDLALSWRGDSLAVDSLAWRLSPDRRLLLRGGLAGLPSADGGLGALGDIEVDRLRSQLELTALRFPVERIEMLRPGSAGIRGELSGRVTVEGPLDEPRIVSEARLDSLRVGDVALDRLWWTAHQEAGRLRLSHLVLERGQSRIDGWLVLPLDFSLLAPPALLRDEELAGDLHLAGRAEDLLGLTEHLAEAGGALEGALRLGGSLAQPTPEGWLRLRDGGLRLSGWEESLEGLSADAIVRGDTLQVLSLHGREGLKWSRYRRGEISGDGWLTLHGPFRYAASLDLSGTSVGTVPAFNGVVSGHLDLGTWLEDGVPPHPFVQGDLDIHEGTLSLNFQDTGGGPTASPTLSYRFDVRAENNLMLVNNEADLELSGELELSSTPAGQEIVGELRTLRGSYTVFGNKFHLLEGYLDFSSAEGINPKIDILAETRTRDDRIEIHITNTFAEPEVDVISEQGYGREDVLRILMGLPASGAGEAGVSVAETVVRSRVEAELLGRLERMVSGELAGLVDFEIENRNLEGEGESETRWQIGRYLPGGIYISYNQGLSLDSDRELALEYRFYNRLWLRSEVINRGREFGEEGLLSEYNIDVRFRFEY